MMVAPIALFAMLLWGHSASSELSALRASPLTVFKPEPKAPDVVRGIYMTAHTVGLSSRRQALFDLIDRTELNTAVIDIKDSQGFVAYSTDLPFVRAHGLLAPKPFEARAILDDAHQRQIWAIARLAVFEDPALASARLDLALRTSEGSVWRTRRGVAWVDTTQKEVWQYAADLARDALRQGFDEVQFDYVRFPSDGALGDAVYANLPVDEAKYYTIASFFQYLRRELNQESNLSVDLFGLTMVRATKPEDDLRIGQRLSDALPIFDIISPMVYPSHYPPTFQGFKNPAEHPGEVVGYSLDAASPVLGGSYKKIRPWLQDFDLGAEYTAQMVRAQIDEVEKRGAGGWLLWNPANKYTEAALRSGL